MAHPIDTNRKTPVIGEFCTKTPVPPDASAAARIIESQRQEIAELTAVIASLRRDHELAQSITGITHDIKNILIIIMGNLQLLLEDVELDASGNRHWGFASKALSRIEDLFLEILDLARNPSREPAPIRIREDVFDEFHEMLSSVVPGNIFHSLRVNADGLCIAHPSELKRVILNLVLNSVQAIGNRSGNIAIEARRVVKPGIPSEAENPRNWIEITVSDNGGGMSPEVLGRVSREAFTTKPRGKGSGVGLQTCRSIAERYGGEFLIRSEEGVGTRATILLPEYSE